MTNDVASARSLALYFDGAANYTLNGTTAITLGAYGTTYSDGRVPFLAGAVPTAVADDTNSYKANVVAIQVKGTGQHTLAVPLTLDATNAVGLTIDQQDTTKAFTISGKLTTSGLPIVVQGAGSTVLSGQISGASAITKLGTGTLAVGGGFANAGVTANVQAGTLQLSSTSANAALDAIADIAGGATATNVGTSTGQLNATYAAPTLTINSGGTFNVNGAAFGVTAVAGTSGTVTNNGAAAATFTTGLNNVGSSFGGTIKDGLGALALTKSGTGTQTLTGASTYSGLTTIAGGTLALGGGNNRLPTGTTVKWTASGAKLDLGGTSQTVADVNADGVTGIAGGGTLTLSTANIGGAAAILDFAGLAGLNATQAAKLSVNGNGLTVRLGSNTAINVGEFGVGTGEYGAATNTSTTLTLGPSTTVNAGNFRVGDYHASGTVNVSAAAAPATVTLRGTAGGASRGNVIVGYNTAGGQSQSGIMDLRGATLDARVLDLRVARYSTGTGNATTTGTFSMNAGTLDAQSITLAYNSSSSGGAGTTIGTLNQDGGTARVSGDVTLGTIATPLVPQTTTVQTATYNLGTAATAGTLRASGIRAGSLTATASNTTATRTLNFNNGVIGTYDDGAGSTADLTITGANANANGRLTVNLAATGTHAFDAAAGRSIIVTSTTVLQGGGALAKSGPGTMRIDGTSTFTGGTTVSAGTLATNNVNALSAGAVAVAAGGTLRVDSGTAVGLGATALAVDAAARVDLRTSGLVVRNGAFATYEALVGNALANGGKYDYAGPGISSADAAARGQTDGATGVGVVSNADLGYASFKGVAGLAGTANEILIAYAFNGDTDLDGDVDGDDFGGFLIGANAAGHAGTWVTGDFDYNQVVNGDDFSAFLVGLNAYRGNPTLTLTAGQVAALYARLEAGTLSFDQLLASVPEPASIGSAAVAIAAFGPRRRRIG